MTRVLVFGLGSIGTLYAYILTRAGVSVTCVCRSNYHQAKTQGFTIYSQIVGDGKIYPRIAKSAQDAIAADNEPFDYVVVCTKALPNRRPDPSVLIVPAIQNSPETTIVLIQNGLGIEDPYRKRFPNHQIISSVTYSPTMQLSPVEIRHTESARLCIGLFCQGEKPHQTGPTLVKFSDLINNGGGVAEIHMDIQVERWKKLIANATWNPICALSRCRDLQFLGVTPLALECVKEVMREVAAVGNAVLKSEVLDEASIDAQLRRTSARSWPGVEPSMMSDILSGRQMETFAVVGEVVRLSREHGILAPRLEMLYTLVSALDWSTQRSVIQ